MEMRVDREEKIGSPLDYLGDSLHEEEKLEEIRRIAYNLYEKKGRLPGTEFASWLEAAQIVKAGNSKQVMGKFLNSLHSCLSNNLTLQK